MNDAGTEEFHLSIIKCECGASILLVRDIAEMGTSIETHALTHAKQEIDPEKAQVLLLRIRNSLTDQVLERASSV